MTKKLTAKFTSNSVRYAVLILISDYSPSSCIQKETAKIGCGSIDIDYDIVSIVYMQDRGKIEYKSDIVRKSVDDVKVLELAKDLIAATYGIKKDDIVIEEASATSANISMT